MAKSQDIQEALEELADEIKQDVLNKLNIQVYRNTTLKRSYKLTNKLKNSIDTDVFKQGKNWVIDFDMVKYGEYVDEGTLSNYKGKEYIPGQRHTGKGIQPRNFLQEVVKNYDKIINDTISQFIIDKFNDVKNVK